MPSNQLRPAGFEHVATANIGRYSWLVQGEKVDMTARKGVARPASPRQLRGERLKDEVYRQMFLLEESRPGAEMGLALALLRAWLAADSKPASDEERELAEESIPDLPGNDRSRIASGRRCASLCAVSSISECFARRSADRRGICNRIQHAGIYWYDLDDPMRCDLN